MEHNSVMETVSGKEVDVSCPRQSDLDIDDIAHALSMLCRFTGHCKRFYSVAEHCCHVHDYLRQEYPNEIRLWYGGLLHDAAEAYVGDVSRPLKGLVHPVFRRLEDNFEEVISKELGVDFTDDRIKKADVAVLLAEAKVLMPSRGEGWFGKWGIDQSPALVTFFMGGRHDRDKTEFLRRFHECRHKLNAST